MVRQNGVPSCERRNVTLCTTSSGSRSRLAAATSTCRRSGTVTSIRVSTDSPIRSSIEPNWRRYAPSRRVTNVPRPGTR